MLIGMFMPRRLAMVLESLSELDLVWGTWSRQNMLYSSLGTRRIRYTGIKVATVAQLDT